MSVKDVLSEICSAHLNCLLVMAKFSRKKSATGEKNRFNLVSNFTSAL